MNFICSELAKRIPLPLFEKFKEKAKKKSSYRLKFSSRKDLADSPVADGRNVVAAVVIKIKVKNENASRLILIAVVKKQFI